MANGCMKKARRGEDVELRLRNVTITEFEITGIALPEVNFQGGIAARAPIFVHW